MSPLRAFLKNFSSMAAGKIIAGLVNVTSLILVAKVLGAKDFGVYSLAWTLGTLMTALGLFGMTGLATREIARNPYYSRAYLVNGMGAVLSIALPVLVIGGWVILRLYPDTFPVLMWGVGAGMAKLFLDYLAAVLFGLQKIPRAVIFSTLQLMGSALLALGLIVVGHFPLVLTFQSQLAWNLLLAAILAIQMHSICPPGDQLQFRFGEIGRMLKTSLPFGIFTLGSILYFHLDTLMLASLKNVTEVGYFQAAMRIVLVVDVFPTLVAGALYPMISKLFVENRRGFAALGPLLARYMLLLALPMAFICALASGTVIDLAFGSGFTPSGPLLAVLAWLIPIRFCGSVFGTMLSACDRQIGRAAGTVFASVLNLVLNLFFIPWWGGHGAAFASLLTAGGLVLFYASAITRETGTRVLLREFSKFFVPVAAFLGSYFAALGLGVWGAILIALLAYGGACLISGAVNPQDLGAIRGALSRKELDLGIN